MENRIGSAVAERVFSVNDGVIVLAKKRTPLLSLAAENNPANQEFKPWPCSTGREYKRSFNDFIQKAGLLFNDNDLFKVRQRLEDKIFALRNSKWLDLLDGPCLPIICPNSERIKVGNSNLLHYWDLIESSHKESHLINLLERESVVKSPSLRFPLFAPRLIFPRALPPLDKKSMDIYLEELKLQYSLSLAGPVEILCAMLIYPQNFKGNFRFFFPGFEVPKTANQRGSLEGLAVLTSNRRRISLEIINDFVPAAYDFWPIMF